MQKKKIHIYQPTKIIPDIELVSEDPSGPEAKQEDVFYAWYKSSLPTKQVGQVSSLQIQQ